MTSVVVGQFRAKSAELKASNGHRPPRRPAALVIGTTLALLWFRLAGLRTAALQLIGFAFFVAAAFLQFGLPAGLLAAAVACFALELLSGESPPR